MSNVLEENLKPLFERAERDGLWFYCSYQDLWFSPKQLRIEQANGRFRWGAVNWRLRDPKEQLYDIEKKTEEMRDFNQKILRQIEERHL